MTHAPSRSEDHRGRVVAGGVLLGIGVMAAVDEIIFHQLLRWHHFYDGSTPAIGIVSDGLLHTGELFALVAGIFLLLDGRRRQVLRPISAWSGFFLGAGGFQVFDGLIDHKVLRIHQIRYGVELLPYDLAWNIAGVVLFAIGVVLYLRSRRTRPAVASGR
jgi:uncharacterized membrane protein